MRLCGLLCTVILRRETGRYDECTNCIRALELISYKSNHRPPLCLISCEGCGVPTWLSGRRSRSKMVSTFVLYDDDTAR